MGTNERNDSDIRRNVKMLKDVFPSADNPLGAIGVVKEALCYDIGSNDVPLEPCYPFAGRYIEITFKDGITLEYAVAVEPTITELLEAAVKQKLNCNFTAKMSKGEKLVYRIEYEYVDLTHIGKKDEA